jgi:Holliday junction resolvase
MSLYLQHTEATGQIIEEEATEFVYEQTQGQPWLVNAIISEVISEMLQLDYSRPVTAALMYEAVQTIILRRDTHIDSLLERLKEERVRRVIEPVLYGETFYERLSDDFQYVTDLGLIKDIAGKIQPSNPIYGEVITRTLSYEAQSRFMTEKPDATVPFYMKDGKIDMDSLLREFQHFWRENSEIWVEKFQYREAAPHLILQAFLQRVINGGGDIIREMATGTGRTDICLVYEGNKYPIELKIRRGEKSLKEGIEQTYRYMDVFGCCEGWLAIFDRRPEVKWEEKIYVKKEIVDGKTVTILGL